MILHDPQPFGGLEEYTATLAVGLNQQGQQVSVLSTTWVPRTNQYVNRLLENGVTYMQAPKWVSWPASHWETKQKILKVILLIASPLILLLTFGLLLRKNLGLRQAWISAKGWLGGQIQYRFIVPNRYQPLMLLLLDWWRILWRPDMLHIQGYTTNLLFVIDWAHKRKIPVLYEEHQTPDARFNWWQGFEKSINKSTKVIAVSERSAKALKEVCGVTRPIVVRSPLLPDPLITGWQRNTHYGDRDRVLKVTTVARLVEAKGLTYLLDTAAMIGKTHPGIEFRVFGEGELRGELLAKAECLGLDGEKIFRGAFTSRKELDIIMAETDIFVMSSILEGQPLSVVEAMAYGCPIVATTVGGIPELIQDGVNGLLCPPRDPECLAEKIIALIENPSIRESHGKAARQTYEQGSFQPAAVSEFFMSVYQNTVREGIPN